MLSAFAAHLRHASRKPEIRLQPGDEFGNIKLATHKALNNRLAIGVTKYTFDRSIATMRRATRAA